MMMVYYTIEMLNYLIPFLYSAAVILLLVQAAKVMLRGFATSQRANESPLRGSEDRTGRITIHPEILNKDGSVAKGDQLKMFARKERISLITIDQILQMKKELLDKNEYESVINFENGEKRLLQH